jgi:hypothetical protein
MAMHHRAVEEEKGRVIKLRPYLPLPPSAASPRSPVDDLGKYERGGETDDERHRMLTNLAAAGFTGLLIMAGLWIATTMADLRKNQDCVLSGRRNCADLLLPGPQRN